MIKKNNKSSFKGVIYLVGFMASGKTTLGRLLANKLELSFFDLDTEIQINEGQTIKQIFEVQGESYFRDLESRYLRILSKKKACIISTGGGTPIFNDNMHYMNSTGITCYLDIPFDVILERLQKDKNFRPIVSKSDINMLNLLYVAREGTYHAAHKVFKYNEQHSMEDQIAYILNLII